MNTQPRFAKGRRLVVLALAVVLVLVLVGDAVGLTVNRRSGTKPKVATPPATTGAPTTTAPPNGAATTAPKPGSVEAFLQVAEAFVEQHRGLKFKNPVQVTTLDDAAFRQRLLSDESTDKSEIEKST